jgi:hypothetical protein
MPTPTAVTRFTSPDPQTNAALQGIQNMLAQLQQSTSQATGPGAGVYVLGPAATVGGRQPSITLDAQGRVLAIQSAT